MRVQGVSPRGRPRPVRAPADHEHRLRRGTDLPGQAAELRAPGRSGPLVGPAGIADAGPTGARPARRLGPVPDSAHPSRAWTRCGTRRERPARARTTHVGVTRARPPIAPLVL